MLQRAEATVFHRFMTSGRTSPAMFGCLLNDGDREGGDAEGDYVVKLRGGMETGTAGLLCEVVAMELADYFGISHPQQALINIDEVLANLIAAQEPSKASVIRNSVGTNFGTKLLSNLITWPVDRIPSASQLEAASEIFAFDALIQNPDRIFSNPNLGSIGDQIYIFDHELAFSFRLDILGDPEPWRVSNLRFLADHVFFKRLQHKVLPLESFIGRLARLPISMLDQLEDVLPREWELDVLHTIKNHLGVVSANAETFGEELMRRLI